MNSQQRRQLRRRFPFEVNCSEASFLTRDLSEFGIRDQDYQLVYKLVPGEEGNYYGWYMRFARQQDAVWFSLKFLGNKKLA